MNAIAIRLLVFKLRCWGGRRGLNPRHSVPQTDALPAELLPPLRFSLTREAVFPERAKGRSEFVLLLTLGGLETTLSVRDLAQNGTC
jgi:hypothetical protein